MAITENKNKSNLVESTTKTKRKSPTAKTVKTKTNVSVASEKTTKKEKETKPKISQSKAKVTAVKVKTTKTSSSKTGTSATKSGATKSSTTKSTTVATKKSASTTKAKSTTTKAKSTTTKASTAKASTTAKTSKTTVKAKATTKATTKSTAKTKATDSTKSTKATKTTKKSVQAKEPNTTVEIPAPLISVDELLKTNSTTNVPNKDLAADVVTDKAETVASHPQSKVIPKPTSALPIQALIISKQPQIRVDNSEHTELNTAKNSDHNSNTDVNSEATEHSVSATADNKQANEVVKTEPHKIEVYAAKKDEYTEQELTDYNNQIESLIQSFKQHFRTYTTKTEPYVTLCYELGESPIVVSDRLINTLMKALSIYDFKNKGYQYLEQEVFTQIESHYGIFTSLNAPKNIIEPVTLTEVFAYFILLFSLPAKVEFLQVINSEDFKDFGFDYLLLEKIQKELLAQAGSKDLRNLRFFSNLLAEKFIKLVNSNKFVPSYLSSYINPVLNPRLDSNLNSNLNSSLNAIDQNTLSASSEATKSVTRTPISDEGQNFESVESADDNTIARISANRSSRRSASVSSSLKRRLNNHRQEFSSQTNTNTNTNTNSNSNANDQKPSDTNANKHDLTPSDQKAIVVATEVKPLSALELAAQFAKSQNLPVQKFKTSRFYLVSLVDEFVAQLVKNTLQNLTDENVADVNIWTLAEGARLIEYRQIKKLKEKIESLLIENADAADIYKNQLAYLEKTQSIVNEDLSFNNYSPSEKALIKVKDRDSILRYSSFDLAVFFNYFPMLETLPLFAFRKVENISVFDFVVAFTACQLVYIDPKYHDLAQKHGINLPTEGIELLTDDGEVIHLKNVIDTLALGDLGELKLFFNKNFVDFKGINTKIDPSLTTEDTDTDDLDDTNSYVETTSSNQVISTDHNQKLKEIVNLANLTTDSEDTKPVSNRKVVENASSNENVTGKNTETSETTDIAATTENQPATQQNTNNTINDIDINSLSFNKDGEVDPKIYAQLDDEQKDLLINRKIKEQVKLTKEELLSLSFEQKEQFLRSQGFYEQEIFALSYDFLDHKSQFIVKPNFDEQLLANNKNGNQIALGNANSNFNSNFNYQTVNQPNVRPTSKKLATTNNQVYQGYNYEQYPQFKYSIPVANSYIDFPSKLALLFKFELLVVARSFDIGESFFANDRPTIASPSIEDRFVDYLKQNNIITVEDDTQSEDQSQSQTASNQAEQQTDNTTEQNTADLLDNQLDDQVNNQLDNQLDDQVDTQANNQLNTAQAQAEEFKTITKTISLDNGTNLTITSFVEDKHLFDLKSGDYERSFGYRAYRYFPHGTFIELLGLPSAQVVSSPYSNNYQLFAKNFSTFTDSELETLLREPVNYGLKDSGNKSLKLDVSITDNQKFDRQALSVFSNSYAGFINAQLAVPALHLVYFGFALVSVEKERFDQYVKFIKNSDLFDQVYAKVADLFTEYTINSVAKVEILKTNITDFLKNWVESNNYKLLKDQEVADKYATYLEDLVFPVMDALIKDKAFIKVVNEQANFRKPDNNIGIRFNNLMGMSGLSDLIRTDLNLYQTLASNYTVALEPNLTQTKETSNKETISKETSSKETSNKVEADQSHDSSNDSSNDSTAQDDDLCISHKDLLANQLVFAPGNFINRNCSDLLFLFLVDLGFLGSLSDNIHIVTSVPYQNPYYRGLTALVLSNLVQRNYLRQKLSLSQLAFPIAANYTEGSVQTYQALKDQSLSDFSLPTYLAKLAENDSLYSDLGFSRLAPFALNPNEIETRFTELLVTTNGQPTVEQLHSFSNIKYYYSEETCRQILNNNFISVNYYIDQVNDPNNHLSPEYLALSLVKGVYQQHIKIEAEKNRIDVTPKLINNFFHNKVKASLSKFQSLTTSDDFNLIVDSITSDYVDNFNQQKIDLDTYINDPATQDPVDVLSVPALNRVIEALTKVALGGTEEVLVDKQKTDFSYVETLGYDEVIYQSYKGVLKFDNPAPGQDWEALALQSLDVFSEITERSLELLEHSYPDYIGFNSDTSELPGMFSSLEGLNFKQNNLLFQARDRLTNIRAVAASILALIELDPQLGGKVNYDLGLSFMKQAADEKHPFAMAYLAKFFSEITDFNDSRVSFAATLPQRVALLDQYYNDLYPEIAKAQACRNGVTVDTAEVAQFIECYYLVKRQYLVFIQHQINQANLELKTLTDKIIPVLEEQEQAQQQTTDANGNPNGNINIDNSDGYSPELIAKAKEVCGVDKDDNGYSQLQAQRSRQHKEQLDLKAERLYRQIFNQLQLKVNLLSEYNNVEEGLVTQATHSHFYVDAVKTAEQQHACAQTFTKESYTRMTRLGEDLSELSGRDDQFPLNYKETLDYLTHYSFYCPDSSGRSFYFDKFAEINKTNEQFNLYRKEFAQILLDPKELEKEFKQKNTANNNTDNANLDNSNIDHLNTLSPNQQAINFYLYLQSSPRSQAAQANTVFYSDVQVTNANLNANSNSNQINVDQPYNNLSSLLDKSLEQIYLEQMANLKRQYVVCFEQDEDQNSEAYLHSVQTPTTVLTPFDVSEVSVEDKYEDQAYILSTLEPFPNYIGDYFGLLGDMFYHRTQKFTSQYQFLVTDDPNAVTSYKLSKELEATVSNLSENNASSSTTLYNFSDLAYSYLLTPNHTINTLVTNLMGGSDPKGNYLFNSYKTPAGRIVLGKKLNAYIAYFINQCKLLSADNLHLISEQDNAQARYYSDLVDYLVLPEIYRADQFNPKPIAQTITDTTTQLNIDSNYSYSSKNDHSTSALITNDQNNTKQLDQNNTTKTNLSNSNLDNNLNSNTTDSIKVYSSIQGNSLVYAQAELDFSSPEQQHTQIAVVNNLSQAIFNFYNICKYLDQVEPLKVKDIEVWVKGNYPLNPQQLQQFKESFTRLLDSNFKVDDYKQPQYFRSFKLVDSIKSLLGTNNYPLRIFNIDFLQSEHYLSSKQLASYQVLIDQIKTSRQDSMIFNQNLDSNYYFQLEPRNDYLKTKVNSFRQNYLTSLNQVDTDLDSILLHPQFTYALRWKIVDHLFRVATSDYCPRNYDARIYYGVYNLLASPYLNSLDTSISLLERNDVPNQTKFGFNQLILGLLYALKSCDLATSAVRSNSLAIATEQDCLDVFIPSDFDHNSQAFLPTSSYSIDHQSYKAKALATLELANTLSSHWMPKFVLGLVYRTGLLGAKVDMRRGKDLILNSLMILNDTDVQFTLKSKVSIFIQQFLTEALPEELANANDFDLIKIVRSFDIAWFAEMISVDSLNLETLIYTWTV